MEVGRIYDHAEEFQVVMWVAEGNNFSSFT